jgi:hypothetical protein
MSVSVPASTRAAPATPIVEWKVTVARTATTGAEEELLSSYCRTGTVTSIATVEYTDHFDDSRGTAHMITVSDLRITDPRGSQSLVTMHFLADRDMTEVLLVSSDVNAQWNDPPPGDGPRPTARERLPEGTEIKPLEAKPVSTVEEVLLFARLQFGMRWDVGQLVLRPRSILHPFPKQAENGEWVPIHPDAEPAWLVQADGGHFSMSVGYMTGMLAWLPDSDFSRSEAVLY